MSCRAPARSWSTTSCRPRAMRRRSASRISRRPSSSRLRSVVSWVIATVCSARPSPSRTRETASWPHTVCPSFLTYLFSATYSRISPRSIRERPSRPRVRSSGCVISENVMESSSSLSYPRKRQSFSLTCKKPPVAGSAWAAPTAAVSKNARNRSSLSLSSSSVRLRSVMSVETPTIPTGRPSASRIRESVTWAGNVEPSLRLTANSPSHVPPALRTSMISSAAAAPSGLTVSSVMPRLWASSRLQP